MVKKNRRIFPDCRNILEGSSGAVQTWKIFEVELPGYFNITILAPRSAIKFSENHYNNTFRPPKHRYWN